MKAWTIGSVAQRMSIGQLVAVDAVIQYDTIEEFNVDSKAEYTA